MLQQQDSLTGGGYLLNQSTAGTYAEDIGLSLDLSSGHDSTPNPPALVAKGL